MERDMVPPQSESVHQFSTPRYVKEIFSPGVNERNSNENIFININSNCNNVDQSFDDLQNGKIDMYYLRAREIVLASGSLPSELELRETGIFAKVLISRGSRYGPFQGKWASVPQDTRFAWEVSTI